MSAGEREKLLEPCSEAGWPRVVRGKDGREKPGAPKDFMRQQLTVMRTIANIS